MNTIFPPHTLGFACIPTLPAAGCGPAAPAAGNQGAAPQQLSLPGCVPTHTAATVCTQIGCPIGHTGWLGCPGGQTIGQTGWYTCPPAVGGAQNTAATLCTQVGCPPHISLPGCVHTGVCPPANGGQAQAQFQSTQTAATTCTQIGCPPANGGGQPQALHISFSPYCLPPANAVAPSTSYCTGPMCHAPAQPDAAAPQFNSTQFHSCPPCNAAPATEQAQTLISAYTYCPTVAPLCPPPANGGQAQAQFQPTQTAATTCTQIGCPPANGGGQAQLYPFTSPTLPPYCSLPGNAGGQAQAQTLPYTHLIGCPNTSTCSPTTQAGGGEQAQTLPPTHAFGCPNTSTCSPVTHAFGCPNTSTCSPVTHALGCPNTSTCSPDTTVGGGQAQAQAFTFLGVCPPVPTMNCIPSIPGCIVPTLSCQQAQGGAPGGAQAQTIYPTIHTLLRCNTALVGCPNTATCSPTTQADGGQAQAQTVFPTLPPICQLPTLGITCTLIGCNPAQGGAQGGAQAQTIFPTTLTPYCTQAANPAGAQAQTIWHTQPGYCSVSTPPLCPTVAVCPPANAGQGGAPIVSAATQCPTVPPMCPHPAPPTCPQPILSAPPHCPTVAPMCAPANGGGQAQAQAFTLFGICPPTISPIVCIVTQVAGCGS